MLGVQSLKHNRYSRHDIPKISITEPWLQTLMTVTKEIHDAGLEETMLDE